MINILNIVLFFLYISSLSVLLYLILRLNIQKKKAIAQLIQSELDNHLIRKQLKEILEENSVRELSESDGFIKFISQSRDWAFQYIEEVQAALAEFDKEISPQLEWATTFGRLSGETVNTNTINIISEAYDKLKLVLPENTETPNN